MFNYYFLIVSGLDDIKCENTFIFYGGAILSSNNEMEYLETSAGRVLSICAVTESMNQSAQLSRETAQKIKFEEADENSKASYRPDIGLRQLIR